MFPTAPSLTADMTLEELISGLSAHTAVDGILLMGSTISGLLHEASDYDIFVVLAASPVPIWVVVASVERRLAEIYFTTSKELDRLIEGLEQLAPNSLEASEVKWIQSGRICFDRSGRLARARDKFRRGEWIATHGALEKYQTWFSVNYNLTQTKRMLTSPEPIYKMKIDLRLLYTIHEVWMAYFKVRSMQSGGEKEDISYLQVHDPEYLALFQECLTASDRNRKIELYEQVAAHALAPLGGLWSEGATAVQLQPGTYWEPDIAEKTLAFWQSLVSG